MDNAPLRSRPDRDTMASAVQGLERVLSMVADGREGDWAAQLDHALAEVKRASQQSDNELRTQRGELVDVTSDIASSATAARQADGLRHELDGVVEEVASLRAEAGSGVADMVAFRARAARLVDVLRTFLHQETQMIQEAVNRDTGGEG